MLVLVLDNELNWGNCTLATFFARCNAILQSVSKLDKMRLNSFLLVIFLLIYKSAGYDVLLVLGGMYIEGGVPYTLRLRK